MIFNANKTLENYNSNLNMKLLSRSEMFIKIFYFSMKEKKKEIKNINHHN
jgi:hypothetical protein